MRTAGDTGVASLIGASSACAPVDLRVSAIERRWCNPHIRPRRLPACLLRVACRVPDPVGACANQPVLRGSSMPACMHPSNPGCVAARKPLTCSTTCLEAGETAWETSRHRKGALAAHARRRRPGSERRRTCLYVPLEVITVDAAPATIAMIRRQAAARLARAVLLEERSMPSMDMRLCRSRRSKTDVYRRPAICLVCLA